MDIKDVPNNFKITLGKEVYRYSKSDDKWFVGKIEVPKSQLNMIKMVIDQLSESDVIEKKDETETHAETVKNPNSLPLINSAPQQSSANTNGTSSTNIGEKNLKTDLEIHRKKGDPILVKIQNIADLTNTLKQIISKEKTQIESENKKESIASKFGSAFSNRLKQRFPGAAVDLMSQGFGSAFSNKKNASDETEPSEAMSEKELKSVTHEDTAQLEKETRESMREHKTSDAESVGTRSASSTTQPAAESATAHPLLQAALYEMAAKTGGKGVKLLGKMLGFGKKASSTLKHAGAEVVKDSKGIYRYAKGAVSETGEKIGGRFLSSGATKAVEATAVKGAGKSILGKLGSSLIPGAGAAFDTYAATQAYKEGNPLAASLYGSAAALNAGGAAADLTGVGALAGIPADIAGGLLTAGGMAAEYTGFGKTDTPKNVKPSIPQQTQTLKSMESERKKKIENKSSAPIIINNSNKTNNSMGGSGGSSIIGSVSTAPWRGSLSTNYFAF